MTRDHICTIKEIMCLVCCMCFGTYYLLFLIQLINLEKKIIGTLKVNRYLLLQNILVVEVKVFEINRNKIAIEHLVS